MEFVHSRIKKYTLKPAYVPHVGTFNVSVTYSVLQRNTIQSPSPKKDGFSSGFSSPRVCGSPTPPSPTQNRLVEYSHRTLASREGKRIFESSPLSESFSEGGIKKSFPQPIFPQTPRHGQNSDLFGSLVGSYEESILSGRMSTLPSHPVLFECEIGVVGLGRSSGKCPPHMIVPFSAYFYEMEGHESPYVGTVDFETYRVPSRGQLQFVISNAERTALKVFLVPYDYRDMPVGSRTFIRQKSYEGSKLCFALHLQFEKVRHVCLTKSLRVVFGGRGDETVIVKRDVPTPLYQSMDP